MGIVAGADDVPDEVLVALVSVFGLRGYAESRTEAKKEGLPPVIFVGTAADLLASYAEPVQREWLAYGLLSRSWDHVEWLMRHGMGIAR